MTGMTGCGKDRSLRLRAGGGDDGAGVSYTYDSRGNRLRTTNALGEVGTGLSSNLGISRLSRGYVWKPDGAPTDWTERSRISSDEGTISVPFQQYEYNARGQMQELWTATRIHFL